MLLLSLGNIGYQIGAAGIVLFSIAFLVVVRWWTDLLGRVIAGVLFSMSSVLIITTVRMLNPELTTDHTFLFIRGMVFWVFGLGIWSGLVSFVWSQFLAPRLRQSERMSTRKEHTHEETDLAGTGPDPDGRSHDRAGRVV